jgi:hypothetical protein
MPAQVNLPSQYGLGKARAGAHAKEVSGFKYPVSGWAISRTKITASLPARIAKTHLLLGFAKSIFQSGQTGSRSVEQ